MNPLEAPVGPGQKFCTIRNRLLIEKQQPRAQVVAELAHVDRHFVVRWWGVGTNQHVHIAEPPGPIGEQMTSEALVPKTKPFWVDDELLGRFLKNLVVDRDERNGETFGQFLIGEAAFGGLELAGRS